MMLKYSKIDIKIISSLSALSCRIFYGKTYSTGKLLNVLYGNVENASYPLSTTRQSSRVVTIEDMNTLEILYID